MQKRTCIVVSGVLALTLSLTLGACSGKQHEAEPTKTAQPTSDGEPRHNRASVADFSAAGSGEADPFVVTSTFPEFDETSARPAPPRDPEARAKLEAKYREVPPAQMQATLDSLLEVLDAQTHNRIQDKDHSASRNDLSALSDEVGWLSERCKH